MSTASVLLVRYDEEGAVEADLDEADFYGLVCDAIMRGHCESIDDDDGMLHTSDVARKYAARFMREIGLW